MKYLKKFLTEDEGQDMVEYGLLAAFISIVAITALSLIGDRLEPLFQKVADALPASGS